jgi:hypothetical protein
VTQEKWTSEKIEAVSSSHEMRVQLLENSAVDKEREDLPDWISVESKLDEPKLEGSTNCRILVSKSSETVLVLGHVSAPVGTPDTRAFRFSTTEQFKNSDRTGLERAEVAKRLNRLELDNPSSVQDVFEISPLEDRFSRRFQETVRHIQNVFKSDKQDNCPPKALALVTIAIQIYINTSTNEDRVKQLEDRLRKIFIKKKEADIDRNYGYQRIRKGSKHWTETREQSTVRISPTISKIQNQSVDDIRKAVDIIGKLMSEFDWSLTSNSNYWEITNVSPRIVGIAIEQYLTRENGNGYSTPSQLSLEIAKSAVVPAIVRELNSISDRNIESLADVFGVQNLHLLSSGQINVNPDQASQADLHLLASNVLPGLRIADLASGSGTYLVAAYDILARIWSYLDHIGVTEDETLSDLLPPALLDEDLSSQGLWITGSRCLHGVDISTEAVLLTRLRMKIAYRTAYGPEAPPEPLRLAHTVVQGDSILGHPYKEDPPYWEGQLPLTYWKRSQEERQEIAPNHLTATLPLSTDDVRNDLNKYYTSERPSVALEALDKFYSDVEQNCQKQIQSHKEEATEGRNNPAGKHGGVAQHDSLEIQQFHWWAGFPQVMVQGGFDTVLFQSPWSEPDSLSSARKRIRDKFIKKQGQFSLPQTKGWYRTSFDISSLMLHRAHDIVKKGGQIAAVVPTSVFQDSNAYHVRKRYLSATSISAVTNLINQTTFENVDRRYRFSVLITEAESETEAFQIKSDVVTVDSFSKGDFVEISRKFVEQFSPRALAFPPIKNRTQRDSLANICESPLIKDPGSIKRPNAYSGWALRPEGELGVTQGKEYIRDNPLDKSHPVFKGSNFGQFTTNKAPEANTKPIDYWTVPHSGEGLPTEQYLYQKWENRRRANEDEKSEAVFPPEEPRVAFRRIASSTNERTMISTLLPAGHFHTNSVRSINPNTANLSIKEKLVLVGLLNSIPYDYFLRKKVGTNITNYTFYETRLPYPDRDSSEFNALWKKVARLIAYRRRPPTPIKFGNIEVDTSYQDLIKQYDLTAVEDEERRRKLRAEIDAIAFRLYDFTSEETVSSVLADFSYVRNPSLMDRYYRKAVLSKFKGAKSDES